jgi:hypothetical protein
MSSKIDSSIDFFFFILSSYSGEEKKKTRKKEQKKKMRSEYNISTNPQTERKCGQKKEEIEGVSGWLLIVDDAP